MAYTLEYYSETLQKRILKLPAGILADYLRLTDLLEEFGPVMRMPHSRTLGEGLFELRLKGREGISRVFYCFLVGQRIMILHCFIKKTNKTPHRELNIAFKRIQEVKDAFSS